MRPLCLSGSHLEIVDLDEVCLWNERSVKRGEDRIFKLDGQKVNAESVNDVCKACD